MTNLQLVYIVVAALVGALLHMILQGGASWKQMLITGIISAVGFAVGYKIAGTVFGVIDICLALLGGYGINATVSMFRTKSTVKALKSAYPDWKNKLNQPK
jgi:uncharacterized protein (DUF697 family)